MRYRAFFIIVLISSLMLLFSSCGGGEENTVRVMVPQKSGFTVTSENLVDVECGSSVSFDINIKDGYAFLSTSAGTYDQLTGVLTIENVTRDTMVDFNVENLGYNTNISYFYKFYGSDADKSSIYEGSSVDNSLYRVAQI